MNKLQIVKVIISKAEKRIAYLDARGQYDYGEYGGCTMVGSILMILSLPME